jgi:predicted nucleic acid-binding protein
MIVIVDTSIWSLVLRRSSRATLPIDQQKRASILNDLIADARVALLGAIRQEILSGIKDPGQFARLKDYLQAFPDAPLEVTDYECAAGMWNTCRSHGIAGTPTDLLICAAAVQRNWLVYASDRDFTRYAKYLPVQLLQ